MGTFIILSNANPSGLELDWPAASLRRWWITISGGEPGVSGLLLRRLFLRFVLCHIWGCVLMDRGVGSESVQSRFSHRKSPRWPLFFFSPPGLRVTKNGETAL